MKPGALQFATAAIAAVLAWSIAQLAQQTDQGWIVFYSLLVGLNFSSTVSLIISWVRS